MPAKLYSMGAVFLASTGLPATNMQYAPNVGGQSFRHDDREFASIHTITASSPMFTFQTPIKNALDEIGTRVTKFTDIDIYLAAYTDAVKDATAKKYTLATSASAFAVITGFSVSQGGICMADVSLALLSADGTTNPLAAPTDEAIPAITPPLLHTIGPFTKNGAAISGLASVSASLNQRWTAHSFDGDLYPQIGRYDGGAPVMSFTPADPVAVLGSNYIGEAITSTTTLELLAMDATTQVPTETGKITVTIADGRIVPQSVGTTVGEIAQGGWDVIGLSDSAAVHPWAIS